MWIEGQELSTNFVYKINNSLATNYGNMRGTSAHKIDYVKMGFVYCFTI